MAYRRKQGITRSATFVEDHRSFSGADDPFAAAASAAAPASPSLAAQAIRASTAHSDVSPPSAFAAPARSRHPQDASNYEYTSMRSLNEPKHGFWGDLARKAKSIIEDGASNKSDDYVSLGSRKLSETRKSFISEKFRSNCFFSQLHWRKTQKCFGRESNNHRE